MRRAKRRRHSSRRDKGHASHNIAQNNQAQAKTKNVNVKDN